ncbi:molybdate ABC transporter substrate-binding protein [Phaeodactylibacter luteus]|nr:molybdate ABC transporter substrate-binding protein [Phaeodactylibacter luteus]
MMKKITFLLALATLAGCTAGGGTQQAGGSITVATAANVQFAMSALAQAFQSQTGIAVQTVISSSGKLTAQIANGAPYDLLVSANMKYPEALLSNGSAVPPAKVYAYGALVAWSLAGITPEPTPEYLLSSNIRKIAVANPKNAPYGEQGINYLEYFGYLDTLQGKLVYGESIAQTNQYITTMAAEVGLTAKSVVLSPEMAGKGQWVALPAGSYSPIAQGVVITQYGADNHPEACQLFFDFLFSEAAQAIFGRYGYDLPQGG